jgi:hypothetical protein
MKLVELVGEQAEFAAEAIKWVENTLLPDCTCEKTLDNMAYEDKLRLIQGLCGIITMWSYTRHSHDPDWDSENELVISIREGVEWEADVGRQGLHAKYLASNILTASTGEEPEFYRQFGLLEQDAKGSLTIRKRTIERVIGELVTWFRYYTWHGYGKTGRENCQDALEYLKRDIVNILEKEESSWGHNIGSDANN